VEQSLEIYRLFAQNWVLRPIFHFKDHVIVKRMKLRWQ